MTIEKTVFEIDSSKHYKTFDITRLPDGQGFGSPEELNQPSLDSAEATSQEEDENFEIYPEGAFCELK